MRHAQIEAASRLDIAERGGYVRSAPESPFGGRTNRSVSTKPTHSIEDVDRRYVFHPFTAPRRHEADGGHLIVRGEGCVLWDNDDRAYLDAMAGLWCVNVGYGRPEMVEAIARQVGQLSYYHAFSSMATEAPALLAERVVERASASTNVPMSKVFFGNSGSDANDTQAKLVWFYNNALGRTAKKKIISRARGYHGVTVLSAGLTGLSNLHDGFDLPLPMIRHVRAPHRLWEASPGMSDDEFVALARRRARGADPAGRARYGRRVHRRAGAGRGRRARAAARRTSPRSRRCCAATTSS